MSKQLSISAVFSTFTMAAFALFATASDDAATHHRLTGAPIEIGAPADAIHIPELQSLNFRP